ncbi:aspartate/glutamate racemase family protein [Flaviflagellibacter deserti]|uniref:Aspartate/glutamate racemase family protein n=1 Tax=Flaviflagellibacter deserti TaxID=2267266 RepID=A0ABV9Z4S7_9HYPH
MLTPSSNTVLEPLTFAMASSAPEVTAHFSRFRVTQIGLSAAALDQFEAGGILAAADLLADANVDVIAWNGTSAAWLGFDRDEALCDMITQRTGIAACTAVLAFRELFDAHGLKRIGLVTPYTRDVQQKIMANWDEAGFSCTAERHLDLSENFSFAEVGEDQIADMVRDVTREGCDAVAIVCTNLNGAALAPRLERELGIPVLDSISVTFWKCMALAGRRPADLSDWGGPFSLAGELGREEA